MRFGALRISRRVARGEEHGNLSQVEISFDSIPDGDKHVNIWLSPACARDLFRALRDLFEPPTDLGLPMPGAPKKEE